ncbi:helix-turn-helix domain-containing protein, partial [Rugosimonospora africana]|uniref:helix-turn-helix domain-containing protein n=1 Tax=Rugosimonospora africana TaxID=556532 RepID=UPI001EF3CCF4
RAGAPAWDITVPTPGPARLAGVAMAGFSDRVVTPVDVEMVAHPAVALIFDLGDGPLEVDDGNGRLQRDRVVAGLGPQGARGRGPTGSFECLQVRLSPVVAYTALAAVPDLSGAVVSLDALWGREAARLQEQLRAAGSWKGRFVIAEAALARRLDAGRAIDPEVAYCWERLMASGGRARVEGLATAVGWSRKRLWSRFRSQIGLTPKRAARLIRFDAAAHGLAAGRSPATVAVEAGYADQSHLHREVQDFAETTPAAVAAAPFLAIDDVAWPTDGRSGLIAGRGRSRRPAMSPQTELRARWAY